MTKPLATAGPCLLLTATIEVREDMVFTARRDTQTRLEDYKKALALWLAHPDLHSFVLVENSGADLSQLIEIADRNPEKRIEFLSFKAPAFDGSLGKGYGEMLCLQYGLDHSQLLAQSGRFMKVSGRHYLANTSDFLRFAETRRDADIICDLLMNLTWGDSRAFWGTTDFLRTYLVPLLGQLNDKAGSNIEHALARAAHACMAQGGTWVEPPFPLEMRGVSGSLGRDWQLSLGNRLKLKVRHRLFVRCLATGPR